MRPSCSRRSFPCNVRWFGLSTSLIGRDRALMELMARSGCSGLLIGLESICEASLSDIRKRFNDPRSIAR